jgi:hypothetical protein
MPKAQAAARPMPIHNTASNFFHFFVIFSLVIFSTVLRIKSRLKSATRFLCQLRYFTGQKFFGFAVNFQDFADKNAILALKTDE